MNLTYAIKAGSRTGEPGWLIQFAYDKETVEQLKARVPHTDREWRPETAEWWVSEKYQDVLQEVFPGFHAMAFQQAGMF